MAGPESNGESAERFALFWTREPPFLRFTVCPITALVLPTLYLADFLRRTFAGVFPLSSRKKFFYNFRIVLFGPSRFLQPRAGRSPRVGFPPPSSAALLAATFVCVFFSVFLLSRFHLVQPFLCYLAFPPSRPGPSLVFVVPTTGLLSLLANCTRSLDWRSFN